MYRHPRRKRNGAGSSRNVESTSQTIAMIDGAVVKSHSDLLAAGESISAWGVLQSALVILKANSFESLGFRMQYVPSLNRLMITEAKVNSFIHCFVAVQKITSLHDLEMAICENEGIGSFEELELGPLLKHPLVTHYFSVGSDVTEIFKITSQQIVTHLNILLQRKRKITVDDLLDYIAKREKESRENLCVRIQRLGMHIGNIMHGRRSAFTLLKKCSDGLDVDSKLDDDDDDDGEAAKNDDIQDSGQTEMDCSLFSSHEIKQGPENICCTINVVHKTPKHLSVGMKLKLELLSGDVETGFIDGNAVDGHTWMFIKIWKDTCEKKSIHEAFGKMIDFYKGPTKPKKKIKDLNKVMVPPYVGLLKVAIASMKFGFWDRMSSAPQANNKEAAFDEHSRMDDDPFDVSTWMFIKIWKDTCQKENVFEAFGKMLDFCYGGKKKTKALNRMTSSYPYVGLVNVAIASIKFGMWDHMISTRQENTKEVPANTNSIVCTLDVNTEEKDVLEGRVCIALEDVVKYIKADFVFPDHVLDDVNSFPKKQFILLREIWKLERSLNQKFSIKDFEILGFGDIFTFLADHMWLLPTTWQNCFVITDKNENPSVQAFMNQHYLFQFLSEAANSLQENETLTKLMASDLLRSQFPCAGLTLLEDDLTADLLTTMSKNGCNPSSNVVLFSSPLSTFREKGFSYTNADTKDTKDTIEVLLRAPMLVDLATWSHWDIKYAPCLGPLVGWLLSEVTTTKELLCLVTKEGKVLRIDHSATVDSFFEAFLHVSCFETAVKLLSLIALYGGEKNAPLSLLKRHAKKAFQVISNKNDVKRAARFLLDCVGCLPKEFQGFAGELLVSALGSINKDAHLVILSECKSREDHMMVHELGLLMGIVEWFDDYCTCMSHSQSQEDSKRCSAEDQVNIINKPLEVKQLATGNIRKESVKINRVQMQNDDGFISECEREIDATNIIESIRKEEFGVDSNILSKESTILKKQHARLGRALHCLSQELYSQDSHFLLELVQNADDNVYPRNVEPTLTFILEEKRIVVMNNEVGFSSENIRALCDVGNSTKKASTAGYIGKKGIGFKSVFRVTDAPEIHSNGFHIKFDLTEGQIGFVLPTVVPPCDLDLFTNLISLDDATDEVNIHQWNTCIVLPFKSNPTTETCIASMFSDLHPSLLLFLHRLQCIKFRNMLTDSFVTMRKETVGNGLVNVSHGDKTLTWFVESRQVQANGIRDDAKTSEISIAFPLEESDDGNYIPKMDQQYVFAFLPLRTYGFRFIIQGDFILPSSREEVDGDSPWNQWLLSEFPTLFVDSQRSFCNIYACVGKGVSAFLSYVPLVGQVHGFFASLPRMIISKLCTSNCLLLQGDTDTWVPPCRVLRNWNEEARKLIPDSLIQKHLGLGYLNKDIEISDSLAKALGIENYGPKIFVQILSSLCCTKEGLRSMGFTWLSSWLDSFHAISILGGVTSDTMNTLKRTPFIPLLDGGYTSIDEGMIWMNPESSQTKSHRLFANLRVVNPALFDSSNDTNNLTQVLSKVGVQKLSEHQVVKSHVLPAVSEKKNTVNKDLMTEYLSFIMLHLQSSCSDCCIERDHIVSEVYNKAYILTNHGFVLPSEVPIHFNNHFGNRIDTGRLMNGIDVIWDEVDKSYLEFPADGSSSIINWRKFLHQLQITDFVQIKRVEKTVSDSGSKISDWESLELVNLLEKVSESGDCEKCKHLLDILDTIWDDYFSGFCNMEVERKSFRSAIVTAFNDVPWVVSSMDAGLFYPKDLFHDCEAVTSILGGNASYAIPKVQSEKLISSLGFKVNVTVHDALSVLHIWKRSATCFKASVSQMSRFYSFIWNELGSSNQNILDNIGSGAFIFVPCSCVSSSEVVSGMLLSPQEVYWHEGIINHQNGFSKKMLSNLYPSLHEFFVDQCGVRENPPLLDYLTVLHRLSTVDTPLKAAKKVFDVFVMWGDGIKSGVLSLEDVEMLKKNLEEKERKVLPTANDTWVSLHPSFGLVCWCDDENLSNEFEGLNSIDFIRLCELTDEEKEMLQIKVSVLMKMLGIPALSEVVTREAIFYGPVDNRYETSLVKWVLPYAQRYIFNTYPERYSQLKLSGFEKLNRLKIVVVDKLFYKNVIKRSKLASKKRHDSGCFFQDEILYATTESDSHSIFLELSRFLINGNPELHLANFLHMITTMTESGSTEEQIEMFVLNSQKVPKIPDHEPVWSIQPTNWNMESSPAIKKRIANPKNAATSSQSNRNWPPATWKTAPKFNLKDLKIKDVGKQVEGDGGIDAGDCVGRNPDLVDLDRPASFSKRDQLSHGSVNGQQAVLTGRRGEEAAFKYYSRKAGADLVKWVNESGETGLPYDIEVCDEESRKEYIEVKTTDSASKDWFEISVREWEFAVEEGECFTIARVVLSGDERGRVTVFKNPASLCRLGHLKLAVLMSKQQKGESTP